MKILPASALGLAFAVLLAPRAGAETYRFDPAHSAIGFSVHQFLGTTKGRFTKFSGTINLDREHPEKSSVEAKIDVNSIDTGIKKRDDHLRSEEFFNVAKYPAMTFKSREVKRTGPESGDITGDLTMHGVTRPVTLHVKLAAPIAGDNSRWEVTTVPLKRSDFNLMFSSGAETMSGISQQVSLNITIVASKAP